MQNPLHHPGLNLLTKRLPEAFPVANGAVAIVYIFSQEFRFIILLPLVGPYVSSCSKASHVNNILHNKKRLAKMDLVTILAALASTSQRYLDSGTICSKVWEWDLFN